MHSKTRLLALVLCAAFAGGASADGWRLSHGRFPGRSSTFILSPEQKLFVAFVQRCHRDNSKTPYLFHLIAAQSAALKKATGQSPSRFAIFDSTTRDKGVDLPINVIVRFSSDRFEIPYQLLVPDNEAIEYESGTMGWGPNPLSNASQKTIRSGKCPGSKV